MSCSVYTIGKPPFAVIARQPKLKLVNLKV